MATEYISREFALHNIECGQWDTEKDKNRAIHYVRELTPAAKVQSAKSGSWFTDVAYYGEDGAPCEVSRCNQCGEPNERETNFCPNCGADMQKGAEHGN